MSPSNRKFIDPGGERVAARSSLEDDIAMNKAMGLAGWAALLLTAAMFGSSFLLTKLAVDAIPPLTVAAGRVALAAAIACGFDKALTPVERRFFYLPFEHGENLADQARCAWCMREHLPSDDERDASIEYARRHRAIIERFGRFPHRNAALGRTSTPAEIAFLDEPNSSF